MIACVLIFLATVQAGPYPVGGDVKAPVAIKRIQGDYRQCTGIRMSGVTILKAIIDKSGHPRRIKIVRPGAKCTDDAAVSALRQWTFKPGTLNGKPVDVIFNLTVIPHVR